jgi:hypothetical protein
MRQMRRWPAARIVHPGRPDDMKKVGKAKIYKFSAIYRTFPE